MAKRVTKAQIRTVRAEALALHAHGVVGICDKALADDETARAWFKTYVGGSWVAS